MKINHNLYSNLAFNLAEKNLGKTNKNEIKMKCLGGDLIIKFQEKDKEYSKITHIGPAKELFQGSFQI